MRDSVDPWKVVEHRRFNEALKYIERCHASSGTKRPRSMRIVGRAGVGKSELIEIYQARYPSYFTDEGPVVRVLVVEIPASPTELTLLTEILLAFGDTKTASATRRVMGPMVAAYLKSAKVELIILDEVHHFVTAGTKIKHHDSSERLKTLLNKSRIPAVLVGSPSSRHLFNSGAQLRSRIPFELVLEAFSWDEKEDRAAFGGVIKAQFPLGFNNDDFVLVPKILKRIWFASDGVLRSLCTFITTLRELNSAQSSIDLVLLSKVFRTSIWSSAPQERDPFSNFFDGRRLCMSGEPFAPDKNDPF